MVLGTTVNQDNKDHPRDGQLLSWKEPGSLETLQSRAANSLEAAYPPEMDVRGKKYQKNHFYLFKLLTVKHNLRWYTYFPFRPEIGF